MNPSSVGGAWCLPFTDEGLYHLSNELNVPLQINYSQSTHQFTRRLPSAALLGFCPGCFHMRPVFAPPARPAVPPRRHPLPRPFTSTVSNSSWLLCKKFQASAADSTVLRVDVCWVKRLAPKRAVQVLHFKSDSFWTIKSFQVDLFSLKAFFLFGFWDQILGTAVVPSLNSYNKELELATTPILTNTFETMETLWFWTSLVALQPSEDFKSH